MIARVERPHRGGSRVLRVAVDALGHGHERAGESGDASAREHRSLIEIDRVAVRADGFPVRRQLSLCARHREERAEPEREPEPRSSSSASGARACSRARRISVAITLIRSDRAEREDAQHRAGEAQDCRNQSQEDERVALEERLDQRQPSSTLSLTERIFEQVARAYLMR